VSLTPQLRDKEKGMYILLFVRENKKDVAGAAPYTFLGENSGSGLKYSFITMKLKRFYIDG